MKAPRRLAFVSPLVRAVRAGMKTQTRRPVVFPRGAKPNGDRVRVCPVTGGSALVHGEWLRSPFAEIGERMYIPEPWSYGKGYDELRPSQVSGPSLRIHYHLDSGPVPGWAGRYRNARFMPAEIARTFVVIRRVWIERLGDVSEADARAEGVDVVRVAVDGAVEFRPDLPEECMTVTRPVALMTLFGALYGDELVRANPLVWAAEFEVVTK